MREAWLKRFKRPKPEGKEAPAPSKPEPKTPKGGGRPWLVVLLGGALGAGILLAGIRALFGASEPPPSQMAPLSLTEGVAPPPPPPLVPAFPEQEGAVQGEGGAPALAAPAPARTVRDPFGLPPYMLSRREAAAPGAREALPPLPLPPPPAALPSPPPPARAAEPPAPPKPAIRCRATFLGQRAGAVLEAGGQEFTLLVGESAPAVGKLIGVKPGECLVETREGRFNLNMEER